MGRLDGKVAVITGAASGFGLATAKLFAKEGAKVVGADVNPKMPEIAAEIPGEVVGIVADVSKKEDIDAMYALCIEKFGKLDILCNNAGISGCQVPLHEYPIDVLDKIYSINVRGYLMVMQGGIKLMLENGKGSIVNTASIGAFKATPLSVGYLQSKASNVMMTKTAAVEYVKNNIRVNAICPGIFNTGIIEGMSEEIREFLGSQIPMGRIGEPEEFANFALFLASDESSYITGQAYLLDGGRDAL